MSTGHASALGDASVQLRYFIPSDGLMQFLRAQWLENGERTFKVVPGEPLSTAFGKDLYRKIFSQEG